MILIHVFILGVTGGGKAPTIHQIIENATTSISSVTKIDSNIVFDFRI